MAHRLTHRLAYLVPLALPLTAGLAQDTARMNQVVQAYVAQDHYMGTVLVAKGPRVIFSKGYGSADLEWNVANAPNTKFRLGSVTKQFTAASILLLEERGKLSVQDPVKKYVADAPASWDKITIFNLLTHTSGIANFTSFPDYPRLQPFATTAEEEVKRLFDKPLDFQPGERWNYSNSGFVVLTYVIEKASGQPYATFVRDNIFTPLGMTESGYDSNSEVIAHRASGYVFENGHYANAGYINMTVPQGAGALYSTTEDLLKWEQGLFGGKLLTPASLKKMTTPFKNNYAFGLEVDTTPGHRVIQHGGGIEGFNTIVSYYPDDQLTVVVLANVNGAAPGQIAPKLAALARGEQVTLASERKSITLDAKTLASYVGAYRMEAGPVMLVTLDGDQLMSKLGNQQAIPILPESRTMFFPKGVDAALEFSNLDAQGRPTVLTLHQNGRSQRAPRLADAEAKPLIDAAAEFAKRFKAQTPAPGGEAALRRLLGEVQQGTPNYALMSAGLANVIRQQLPTMQPALAKLGAVQSVTFKGVGPGGADIYEVKFANGGQEWRIWLTPDGKIDSANFRAAPTG
ncbi:MAG TPA: serine hydrolase [Gemmatimonadaceae bacterium]|nr:serine hydrolase [Gemmatimonadaceae bacterium]